MYGKSKGVLRVDRNNYFRNKKENVIVTPFGICDWIYDKVNPVLKKEENGIVVDLGCNDGRLLKPWYENKYFTIGVDKNNNEKRKWCTSFYKTDFLNMEMPFSKIPMLIITNSPFNNKDNKKKFLPFEFLKQICNVYGKKIPVVLFAPHGFRLNCTKRIKKTKIDRWRWLRDSGMVITSIVSLPLDIFEGIKFHTEILIFNLPKLESHYFIEEKYLWY